MERRTNSRGVTELRGNGTDEPRKITGYASVFYDGTPKTEYVFDSWGDTIRERIMPGAFDRAIREDDVRALFNHNSDHILGRNKARTLELTADRIGLKYVIDTPDTPLGHSLVFSVSRGDLSGSSFAFMVDDDDMRREGDAFIREVKAVRLFDVGPVTYPAYNSSTAATRNLSPDNTALRAKVVTLKHHEAVNLMRIRKLAARTYA